MPLRCVIFDMDGTITDSLPLCLEAYRQGLEPFVHRRLSDEEIYATFGPSDEGSIRVFAPDNAEAAMESFLKQYKRLHPLMCPKTFDGMSELLQELRDKHLPLGLVTGKGPRSLAITLEELNLGQYFDVVETGSPLKANKPEGIRNILQRFNIDAGDAVYIGDTPSDILSSREVGIPIYSAAWAATAKIAQLKELKPDKILHSVAELREALS